MPFESICIMTKSLTASFADRPSRAEVESGSTFSPKFDNEGLIPAIVTDNASGEVLMFAFMNKEALAASITTRHAHFWSRSRGKLWKKGEESGNVFSVVEMFTDCDQDAIVVKVSVLGAGVTCHTGARSCFYRRLSLEAAALLGTPLVRL